MNKCQVAHVKSVAAYFKSVFAAWGQNAAKGADLENAKAAASSKLRTSWDKAVASADKQGVNCSTPTLDTVLSTLGASELSLCSSIEGGLGLPNDDAGKLGATLFKISSSAFAKLVTAYAAQAKSNNSAKLDSTVAKIRATLVAAWGKAVDKASDLGVTYSGPTETDAMNALDAMAQTLVRLVAEGPIHIEFSSGLVSGATTNVGQLSMSGTVVNPAGVGSTEFGGTIMASVNGVQIPASVATRGSAKLFRPSKAEQVARAEVKALGGDPGALDVADQPLGDSARATLWGFNITIPVDFGSNTITIQLYDLNHNLLAASQSWSVFSTTPPADLLATLTWDTNGTDVDFHSSSKATDGSYDYGNYHTYYSQKTSGFGGNMVLDFDNTYGYGPEHITVDRANPAGESIYLKVYYYSDHNSEEFIPTTAYVNVKKRGQSVYDGSSGLGADSSSNSWADGAHIWNVGEFTLDPTDNYAVTIGQIDTSAFPDVTVHVNVQGKDDTGAMVGVSGLVASNFYAINNNYFMTLTSCTGDAGDYQITYTDKTAGKRPLFVAVTENVDDTIRSGCSDVTTYGKSYALLVGINDYQTINDLSYCVADVDSLQAALQATQMFSGTDTQVVKMTDSAAAKTAVVTAIGNVSSVMQKEDLFLFHFSGHGGDGANENTQTLCMWDTNSSDYSGEITVSELTTALDSFAYGGVTNVYVFLDACHSGNFISQRAAEDAAKGNKPRFYLKPGQKPRTVAQPYASTFARNLRRQSYFVMTAARGSEVSWDVGELGHGLFTNYLLAAIGGSDGASLGLANANGDVMTTCEEAFAYLQPLCVQYSTANMTTVQTPCCFDDDATNPARLKFIW